MIQVYVWGAGFYARQVLDEIDVLRTKVLGIIDSDKRKQGTELFHPIPVISPSDIFKKEFDYLIISVRNYEAVERDCKELGISSEKVISYWKEEPDNCVFIKRAQQVDRLICENQIYRFQLDSAPYEWGVKPSPMIQEGARLLERIAVDGSSLCRFGDGEFEMIRGKERLWYQEPGDMLGRRLKEVLFSKDARINIAIPQNFYGLDRYKEDAANNIRMYMFGSTREYIFGLLDRDRIYYDAYVSRPYIMYKDKKNADEIFPLFKALWRGRDVLIVEGEYSRIGVGNDLMACAHSVSRILCPFKNAWNQYESILNTVLEKSKKEMLICISLGPCATILAYDLAKQGYQALDIGQLDNEYDWYTQGVLKREDIPGKMVAERPEGQNLDMDDKTDYLNQIVARISNTEA